MAFAWLGIFELPIVNAINRAIDSIAGENLYAAQRFIKFLWVVLLYSLFAAMVHKPVKENFLLISPREGISAFWRGSLFRFVLDICLFVAYLLIGDIAITGFSMNTATFPYSVVIMVSMLFTAFTEEIMYRGYLLNELSKGFNMHIASFAVAFLFGYEHMGQFGISGAVSSGLFSLLLNYGFLWSKSLYFVVGMHWMANTMGRVLYSDKLFVLQEGLASDSMLPWICKITIFSAGLCYLYISFHKRAKDAKSSSVKLN